MAVKQLTETELLWANLLKSVRANVRLRFAISADRKLNKVIPGLEKDFMLAVKEGRAQKFAVETITGLVEELRSGEADATS